MATFLLVQKPGWAISPKIELDQMVRMRSLLLASISLFASISTTLSAQTEDELFAAFSGMWFVFDPQLGANSEACEVRLSNDDGDAMRGVRAVNCSAPLSELAGWTIVDGQLDLRSGEGVTVLRLGGNQQRVTGEFADTGFGIVMERSEGSARATDLAAALRRHRCFFIGYSTECADQSALRRPAFTQLGGTIGEVETLVDLNVRSQPRADASVVGVLPAESCIRVNQCLIASDGVWCRARFGEQEAWLAKTVIRQDEWPVVTFVGGCGGD
jgi:hypothetical protein